MIAKYNVEYAIPVHGRDHQPTQHYLTNDPVNCEEFLSELLESGILVRGVSHEGVPLSRVDFDKMVKTAAGMLATRHICRSLGVDSVEAHHRFGSPA
jgi:hypothetical protein